MAVTHKNSILLTRRPVYLGDGFDGLYSVLGGRDRTGILLVDYLPCGATTFLTELAKEVFGMVLENPRTLVLGDFCIQDRLSSVVTPRLWTSHSEEAP